MKPMTEKNILDAFAGESMAHMKYLAFSEKAKKEGFDNISRLYKAIAYAEQVHATNHLKALSKIGDTVENLEAAFNGEDFEIESMYPAYKSVAELEGEKKAIKFIEYALEAEKDHRDFYSQAKKAATQKKDADLEKIWVCDVCGHTYSGESPPDKCPVCNVGPDKYTGF